MCLYLVHSGRCVSRLEMRGWHCWSKGVFMTVIMSIAMSLTMKIQIRIPRYGRKWFYIIQNKYNVYLAQFVSFIPPPRITLFKSISGDVIRQTPRSVIYIMLKVTWCSNFRPLAPIRPICWLCRSVTVCYISILSLWKYIWNNSKVFLIRRRYRRKTLLRY